MSRLSLILLCACSGPADQQTDAPTTGPCLTIESPDPIELDGRLGPTQATVSLQNACDEPKQITAVLADGYERRISLNATQLDLPAGQSAPFIVAFDGEMIGSAFDVLTLGGDVPDRTFEIIATGPTPDLVFSGVPATSVRSCPVDLALSVEQIGDGRARLTELSLSVNGPAQLTPAEISLPVAILPDEPLVIAPRLTVSGPGATLDVVSQEHLIGRTSIRFDLALDDAVEVVQTVPAAPSGPTLDVVLTIDRDLASGPRAQVAPLLDGLLHKLGEHYDYRVVGLIRDDGCPLNRALPYVDSSWDVDKAVDHLIASVDLYKERTSPTEGEYRLLDRVESALRPENTKDAGCNAWRRPKGLLLTWHITAHRDLSDEGDVTAHVNALRALVPFDDMVRVHGVAGLPPHGCEGADVAPRLWDAANLTGGLMTSTCSARWSDAVRSLDVDDLGDPLRVVLGDIPLMDSIVVEVDGTETDRWTLDGAVMALHFSAWDPATQTLVVKYVPASACP